MAVASEKNEVTERPFAADKTTAKVGGAHALKSSNAPASGRSVTSFSDLAEGARVFPRPNAPASPPDVGNPLRDFQLSFDEGEAA